MAWWATLNKDWGVDRIWETQAAILNPGHLLIGPFDKSPSKKEIKRAIKRKFQSLPERPPKDGWTLPVHYQDTGFGQQRERVDIPAKDQKPTIVTI